jgi:spore coat polysaccharide biosynthesis protein SpsF (cytidylyltransferase family)
MNTVPKVVGIVQARMGSTRLSGKSLLPLADIPSILVLLSRLKRCTRMNELWLATTLASEDDRLADTVAAAGWSVFRGSSDDVLDRFFVLAQLRSADVIVRLTGDCPFHDAKLVDSVVARHMTTDGVRYTSNTIRPTFPDGLDVEVFTISALAEAHLNATDPREREHVTMAIHGLLRPGATRDGLASVENLEDFSSLRWTLDTAADYQYLSVIAKALGAELLHADWEQILDLTKSVSIRTNCPEPSGRNENVLSDIASRPLV